MSVAAIDAEKTQEAAENLASRVPDPVGYKMLVVKPEINKTTDGGIALADVTTRREEAGAVVGLVLKQGPMCYADTEKFPTGPWCKEGDFVLLRAYSGSRFMIDGKEFIIVNDDMVEGVVADPRGIGRAY